jgi:uncharacterized protein YebE (UPF0316 family)
MSLYIAFTGVLVFLARVVDVSLGTLRTISIVNGRSRIAFLLGLVEVSIWLVVISTVVERIHEAPVLGLFYAVGFAMGNVVGIFIEKRLAMGFVAIRAITMREDGRGMAGKLRELGYSVTVFTGEGMKGPVIELFIVSSRREQRNIVAMLEKMDPDVFYVSEQANVLSGYRTPLQQRGSGWRSVGKKK